MNKPKPNDRMGVTIWHTPGPWSVVGSSILVIGGKQSLAPAHAHA